MKSVFALDSVLCVLRAGGIDDRDAFAAESRVSGVACARVATGSQGATSGMTAAGMHTTLAHVNFACNVQVERRCCIGLVLHRPMVPWYDVVLEISLTVEGDAHSFLSTISAQFVDGSPLDTISAY
jgi:hypothetical protein